MVKNFTNDLKNNLFVRISINNMKEKKIFYIMLLCINWIFYSEQFMFNIFLVEEISKMEYNSIHIRDIVNILIENNIIIFVGVGIIVLGYDIFEGLQSKNIVEYKVIYESGASKNVIFLHKLSEYIIVDVAGFCISMLMMFLVNYDIHSQDVRVADFICIFCMCTAIKHIIMRSLCFKTSRNI